MVRWQPPPPRPVLYVNASSEAEQARMLLDEYDIDFETRSTNGPAIELHWNGQRSPTSSGSQTSWQWRAGWCRRSERRVAGAAMRRRLAHGSRSGDGTRHAPLVGRNGVND
jgi:hypothetical protein